MTKILVVCIIKSVPIEVLNVKINLTKIKRTSGQTHQFSFEQNLEPLLVEGESIPFLKPVTVKISLTNTGGKLLHVTGTINARVKLVCGRCLSDFEQEINIDFEENFIPSSEVTDDQVERLEDEELTMVKGEELDLTEKVIENITLALPMKIICNEECKGMCQECGVNLNEQSCSCKRLDVDPRLQVLEKLLKS